MIWTQPQWFMFQPLIFRGVDLFRTWRPASAPGNAIGGGGDLTEVNHRSLDLVVTWCFHTIRTWYPNNNNNNNNKIKKTKNTESTDNPRNLRCLCTITPPWTGLHSPTLSRRRAACQVALTGLTAHPANTTEQAAWATKKKHPRILSTRLVV